MRKMTINDYIKAIADGRMTPQEAIACATEYDQLHAVRWYSCSKSEAEPYRALLAACPKADAVVQQPTPQRPNLGICRHCGGPVSDYSGDCGECR